MQSTQTNSGYTHLITWKFQHSIFGEVETKLRTTEDALGIHLPGIYAKAIPETVVVTEITD